MEILFFHQTEMVSLLCAMNHCRVPFHSSPTLDVQPLPCLIWTCIHGKETREISISCEMPWIMMFLTAMIDFLPRYLLRVQVATNAKSTNLSGLPQFSEMICKAYDSKTALKMQRLEGPLILGILISCWFWQNDEQNPWIFRNLFKVKINLHSKRPMKIYSNVWAVIHN